MNNIHFLNFASDGTNGTKNLIEKQSIQSTEIGKYGISQQYNYTNADILDTGLQSHPEIINIKKGCGLWLWKPYFILKSLLLIPYDDFLLYLDADISVRKSPKDFVYKAKEQGGIAVMKTGFENDGYTKREAFLFMNAEDCLKISQLWAGVLAFENTLKVRNFVLDWLLWCTNYQIIADDETSKNHRHDQSILTILAHKAGFIPLENEWNVGFAHPPE